MPPTAEPPAAAPERPGFAAQVRRYFQGFRVLAETRSEYWGVQLVNVIDSATYFALLEIASVFLSEDIGLDDTLAGYGVALFTVGTTVCLFFSGTVTDWLGIRRSTHVAMLGQSGLRLGIAAVGLLPWLPHRGWLAIGLLALSAPFMAMVQTVFQTANTRFTTARSRAAGFSLWYLGMNLGSAAGGFLIDLVRRGLGWSNSYLFTIAAAAGLLCSLLTWRLVRTEDQLGGPAEGAGPPAGPARNPFQIALEVLREPALWRLLALAGLILGARAVFSYNYLLFPKYWLRTIGGDAAIGTLQAINPILVVVGIVLFVPLVGRFRLFSMLVYGAMVSCLSLFVLALPWQLFSADLARSHYLMSVLCMAILSVGEVVWSPKLYEYTAAIAPPGQEGTYLGLSQVPWFAAKTLVSVLSGHFLVRWCPDGIGPRLAAGQVPYWDSPAAMWLVLGLYGMAGCLLALLLRGWLTRGLRDGGAAAT